MWCMFVHVNICVCLFKCIYVYIYLYYFNILTEDWLLRWVFILSYTCKTFVKKRHKKKHMYSHFTLYISDLDQATQIWTLVGTERTQSEITIWNSRTHTHKHPFDRLIGNDSFSKWFWMRYCSHFDEKILYTLVRIFISWTPARSIRLVNVRCTHWTVRLPW